MRSFQNSQWPLGGRDRHWGRAMKKCGYTSGRRTIAHVLPSLDIGGAETNVVRLSSALARRDWNQVIIGLTPDYDDRLVGQIEVPFVCLPSKTRCPVSSFRLALALARANVSVIHGTNLSTWLDCAGARMLLGGRVPLVQCFQGPATFETGRRRDGWRAALLRRLTTSCVAVSQDISNRLINQWGVREDTVQVISNLVDLDRFTPPGDTQTVRRALNIPRDAFVVSSVGSLYTVKNHRLLIDAFARVVAHRPDSVLLIVGDGPLRADLESQSRHLGLTESVRFCGYQSEVHDYLAVTDVYVQPSTHEGSPLAVLEAMAMRLPVIAARSTGCVELNQRCHVPVLVDASASTELAERVVELCDDEVERNHLGARARAAIQRYFSAEVIVDQYARLFETHLEPRRMCSPAGPVPGGV